MHSNSRRTRTEEGMNFLSRRLPLITMLCTFSLSSDNDVSLSMKIKNSVYQFLGSLQKNEDTSYIQCEGAPVKFQHCDNLIINPNTGIPEAKLSHIPSWQSHIIYLDHDIVASIRKNNFRLTKKDKYIILYKIGLIKIRRNKVQKRHNLLRDAALISMALSVPCFQIAAIAWYEKIPHVAKLSAKIGAGACLASTLCFLIHKKTEKTINAQQDLLDTIQKAHQFAQNELAES